MHAISVKVRARERVSLSLSFSLDTLEGIHRFISWLRIEAGRTRSLAGLDHAEPCRAEPSRAVPRHGRLPSRESSV